MSFSISPNYKQIKEFQIEEDQPQIDQIEVDQTIEAPNDMTLTSIFPRMKIEQIRKEFLFINVGLLGPSNVGKNALVHQFLHNEFTTTCKGCWGDINTGSFICNYEKVARKINLQIWSLSTEHQWCRIVEPYQETIQVAYVLFSVWCRDEFEKAKILTNKIKKEFPKKLILLIGTKNDLQTPREISNEEVQAFAKRHQVEYYVTSSKMNQNVELIFKRGIELFLKNNAALIPAIHLQPQPNEVAACSFSSCSLI